MFFGLDGQFFVLNSEIRSFAEQVILFRTHFNKTNNNKWKSFEDKVERKGRVLNVWRERWKRRKKLILKEKLTNTEKIDISSLLGQFSESFDSKSEVI
jgi:hypothetical protein